MPEPSPESLSTALPRSLAPKRDRLFETLRGYQRCVVALSAGVDSAVVAKAAFLTLGEQASAVTAASASLAAGELETAVALARQIGIRHEVIATNEFADPDYVRNNPDRCYHCKTELYSRLGPLAMSVDAVIVNGANLDDQGDYRPGMQAAAERAVRSPLIECELTKAEVRLLAAHWGLPVWDKPATPCLSSRVAYGEEVTAERVAMIDRAEQYLRGLGLQSLRVRYHRGDLARLEVPLEAVPRLCEPSVREELVRQLREIGFRFVTLDLEGFRSGSLNTLLPVEQLLKYPRSR
ncbi:MAG: ATP-dependent sacrificial sulfur transferase LarE [Pirellulales bacterium]|nr:ATP-dependent sacrificial sulfur transferase LarE [Pirellulales bacterium]